ncbi:unnamed protein product [Rhizophagus irregularis]|nr:unnamed protein product [Rhizophagus irregularis]
MKLIFMFTAEAAAVYCVISTFVVVDCGGGTLDLTTRKLVGNNQLQLSEVTERSGDFLWKCIYIGNIAPSLLQYVSESGSEWMGEWVIKINYNAIKSMFDPLID